MNPRPLIACAALLALVVVLAGCSMRNETPQESPEPTPSPSPSKAEEGEPDFPVTVTSSTAGTGLMTFEADLDPAAIPEWGDPYALDEGYELSSPDTGQGSWGYTEKSTGCQIHFFQGAVSGIDTTAGDEVASADVLALLEKIDPETARATAGSVYIANAMGGQVQFRALSYDVSGGQAIVAVRAFGTAGRALYVRVGCPTGTDVQEHFTRLMEESLSVLLPASAQA